MKGRENKRSEEDFLRSIVEATASVTGADFFRSLVRNLASTLQVRYAFVAECKDEAKTRVKTLEFWEGEGFGENFEYEVSGTPCEKVIDGTVCYHTENVQALFPEDKDLLRWKIESYLGIPLVDGSGEVMGHLAVLGDVPMDRELDEMAVLLKIFAARAAAELERKRTEEELRDSEAQLRTLVEHAPEGILVFDADANRFIDANRNAALILGYPRDHLLEMSWIAVSASTQLGGRPAAEVGRPLNEEALAGGLPVFEWTFRTAKGMEVVTEVRLVRLPKAGRSLLRASITDITERKQAEAALKYRSDFEDLITEISTHFINLSPKAIDGGINDALGRIGAFVAADRGYVFLLHDEGTRGSNTHEWCAEGVPSTMQGLQDLPAEMFPWFMGFLYRGEAVHIPSVAELPPEAAAERSLMESHQTQSVICVPMVSSSVLIGFLGVDSVRRARSWSEDVIRLLKIAGESFANALQHKWDGEALQRANEELEKKVEERTRELRQKQAQLVQSEKMASLGQLVAGVAHEINTPLGALRSNVDISRRLVGRVQNLLSNRDSQSVQHEKLSRHFKQILELNTINETATARILTIVDSLRRFARLDEAELDEVDIHEGIENTLTLVRHELKTRVEVQKDYGDIPRINCFPNQLNQAFMNLLVNAAHAIQGQGQILIRTRLENEFAIIEIRDNGIGIPEENLERIFDPGFTTKQSGIGTGLGLSIVYQIIQDHRGKIEVESKVGQGTTFRLTLPVA